MQRRFKTMREEITILIREKILKGEFKQGDRIKEAELSEELGVSRGPIREAFRELEKEGLLTYSSRKGCSVRLISAKESAENYILRASFENLAVKMCKGQFSEETIQKLEAITLEMEQYNNFECLLDVIRLDEAFHELIIRECGMDKLYEMWASLNSSNAVIFFALYQTEFSPNELLAENHTKVLDIIKSGDVDKICDEIQYHYLIVSQNLYRTEKLKTDFDLNIKL